MKVYNRTNNFQSIKMKKIKHLVWQKENHNHSHKQGERKNKAEQNKEKSNEHKQWPKKKI